MWLIFDICGPAYFKIWCNNFLRCVCVGLVVGGDNMNDSRIRTGIMAFPIWYVCHWMCVCAITQASLFMFDPSVSIIVLNMK